MSVITEKVYEKSRELQGRMGIVWSEDEYLYAEHADGTVDAVEGEILTVLVRHWEENDPSGHAPDEEDDALYWKAKGAREAIAGVAKDLDLLDRLRDRFGGEVDRDGGL